VRESIAAAVSQATYGQWLGGANWDPAGFYFIDNLQGECGAIWFASESMCAGLQQCQGVAGVVAFWAERKREALRHHVMVAGRA
jgi:hypothetical protein